MPNKKSRKAYTPELDDVAAWFENSGLDKLSPQTIARIIRKWIPESALKPEYRKKSKETN